MSLSLVCMKLANKKENFKETKIELEENKDFGLRSIKSVS